MVDSTAPAPEKTCYDCLMEGKLSSTLDQMLASLPEPSSVPRSFASAMINFSNILTNWVPKDSTRKTFEILKAISEG